MAYAAALLDATERMQRQSELTELLQVVVAEAATVIPADGAAIVRYAGIRRTLVDTYGEAGIDEPSLSDGLRAVVADGWLFRPGCVDDLRADSRWLDGPAQVVVPTWRSLLVVALASQAREDQFRLVWFSSVPRSLVALSDVADLFARHASLAVHLVDERTRGTSPASAT